METESTSFERHLTDLLPLLCEQIDPAIHTEVMRGEHWGGGGQDGVRMEIEIEWNPGP